ncbi:hypothetical protein ACFL35_12770 [Candidatus Riflebacteria bacterium]
MLPTNFSGKANLRITSLIFFLLIISIALIWFYGLGGGIGQGLKGGAGKIAVSSFHTIFVEGGRIKVNQRVIMKEQLPLFINELTGDREVRIFYTQTAESGIMYEILAEIKKRKDLTRVGPKRVEKEVNQKLRK